MRRRDLLAAAAAATPLLARAQGGTTAAPAVDWPALRLLDGSEWPAPSWHGQPAVVVVWATHCPFCKRHNAHIDRLYRETRGANPLRILTVALDSDESRVRQYMAHNGYRFPVVLDQGRLRQLLTPRRVIPTTVVLDARGRVVQAIPGEMFAEDVMDLARLARRLASG